MGRTKRRRKQNQNVMNNLSSDLNLIALRQWMRKFKWCNNTCLKIASFPLTGRGVMSSKNLNSGDILIEIPFKLMITYTVLENSDDFVSYLSQTNVKFTIHDLLSLYLLYEYDKGEISFWYNYIKSLPTLDEIGVIWLCSEEELQIMNDDLLIMVNEEKNSYNESWCRVQTLLDQQCTRGARVVTRDLYLWAYTLVNTRSVYVDPLEIRQITTTTKLKLKDEPSMAICPFLDMFNHSSNINTTAHLSLSDPNGYSLKTSNTFKKYNQIFISYGALDNKKLLSQYGFILPQNEYDTLIFSLKDILSILKTTMSSKSYKFLCERKLDKDLFVGYTGCSFNMAAVLYVLNNENDSDWSIKIYSADFNDVQMCTMYSDLKILLEFKLSQFVKELNGLKNRSGLSSHFELYVGYVQNRIEFLMYMIRNVVSKYLL